MVRKVILGIFIAIFVIFLMSHNANAVNFDLSNYSLIQNVVRSENSCRLQNGETAPTGLASCSFDSVSGIQLLKEIQTLNTFDLKKGDIVEYYFIVATQQNYNASGGDYFINEVSNANGLITLDYEAIDDYGALDFVTFDNQLLNENAYVLYDFFANYKVAKVYRITQLVPSDGSYKLGLNITSTSPNRYIFNFIQSVQDVFYFSIKNFNIYRRSESQENKEVEEKTQGAVDQSTSDGNSSQNTVESSTQSLMSAGGSIISALVNAPATDCNINVQTTGSSRLFTTAIGQLNLCSDVPQGVLSMVQGIVALVFTPIVLYFTYNVLTTLYNQFKEYNS